MERFYHGGGTYRITAAVGALLILASCAHVNRDELAGELEQIRQEIRQGDDSVVQQLQQTEQRLEARITAVETELAQLQDEFDVTVERFESAIRFNSPVHFAFDDATVRPQDRPILDRFAQVVGGYYEDAVITVEGFTDPAGSAEYNQRLGEQRAEAVREYLAGQGIPMNRMRAVSYGQSSERQIVPGAQGPGDTGWENRRVALVIDFGQGEAPALTTDQDR